MTDDLIAWLRAQLDEDAATASAASVGPWTPWRGRPGLGLGRLAHAVVLGDQSAEPGGLARIATESWIDAEHIARHDPARVLAEVDAKRRILDAGKPRSEHEHPGEYIYFGDWSSCTDDCPGTVWYEVVKLLALPYADRPGYRDEWRP